MSRTVDLSSRRYRRRWVRRRSGVTTAERVTQFTPPGRKSAEALLELFLNDLINPSRKSLDGNRSFQPGVSQFRDDGTAFEGPSASATIKRPRNVERFSIGALNLTVYFNYQRLKTFAIADNPNNLSVNC